MKIHEYQAKELLRQHDIPVPPGFVASSPIEAEFAMLRLKTNLAVVKAQIHAGGRGKAGGVKLVKSPNACRETAAEMLGKTLVTHQTGPAGRKVRRVYIEAGSKIEREFYLAFLIDRATASVAIVASTAGGMDIEEVAAKDAEKIITVHINPRIGLQGFYIYQLIMGLGLGGTGLSCQFFTLVQNLYRVFMQHDLSLLEINPLAVVEGRFMVLDTKITIDDAALFRQEKLVGLRDFSEEDERESEASKFSISYIGLQGSIGCLVNGAGLAMATMDIIKHCGGEPANFLDVGGGATEEQVTNAFRIILQDPAVKGIFVNIFGGIMRCDVIASALITAARNLKLQVPVVVRLEGTNVEQGKEILARSDLQIIAATDMADGAEKIVELVKGART